MRQKQTANLWIDENIDKLKKSISTRFMKYEYDEHPKNNEKSFFMLIVATYNCIGDILLNSAVNTNSEKKKR